MSNPALRYSLYRLGIFAVSFAAALLVTGLFDINGMGGVILAIGIAAGVSALISFRLLNAHREAMSQALYTRLARAKASIDEDAEAEDRAADSLLRGRPGPSTKNA